MSWIAYAFYCSSSPSYLRETHPPDSVSAVQPSYKFNGEVTGSDPDEKERWIDNCVVYRSPGNTLKIAASNYWRRARTTCLLLGAFFTAGFFAALVVPLAVDEIEDMLAFSAVPCMVFLILFFVRAGSASSKLGAWRADEFETWRMHRRMCDPQTNSTPLHTVAERKWTGICITPEEITHVWITVLFNFHSRATAIWQNQGASKGPDPRQLVVEFFDKGPFEDSQLELLRQSMGTPGVPEFAQTARRNFDATHVLWVESERKFESQKAQARNMAGKALNELNRQEEMFLQPIRAEARALIAALEASERAQTGPLRDAISRVKREIDRVRDERRDLERKKRHAEMEARQAEMRARMDNERPLLSDDSGQAPPPFGPSGGGSGQSAPPFAHSGGGSAQAPPPFGPSGGGRSQAPPPFGPSGGGGSGFDAAIQQLERREHEMEEHRRHLERALDAEKSEFRRREQMVETWRMEAESPIKSHFSQARARVTARRDTLVSRVDSAQNAHRVKYLPCMINICHACMGESERAQRFVVPAQQTPSKTDLQNCADLRGEFVGLDQVPAPPSYFPRSQAPHFGPMATVITPHVEALIRIF